MIQSLNGGENVYMIQQGIHTKMVTESGTQKFYVGTLAEFSAESWASYTIMDSLFDGVANGYLLKRPMCMSQSLISNPSFETGSTTQTYDLNLPTSWQLAGNTAAAGCSGENGYVKWRRRMGRVGSP